MNEPNPSTPAEALALALQAQERCAYLDAERWGWEAVRRAGAEAPETAYRGLVVVGYSLRDRGKYGAALRIFNRALDRVRMVPALEAYRGPIHHEVFAGYAMAGALDAAEEFHGRAVALYPADHPQRFALDADRAWFYIDAGDFATGADQLPPLLEQAREPGDRLTVAANLAVAAAGARRPDAGARLRQLLERLERGEGCGAWALYSAAHASALRGDIRAAREMGARARRLAAASHEEDTRRRAATLLASVSR